MSAGRTPGTKRLRAIRKGGAWTGSGPHSPLTETPNHSELFHCQRWNTEFLSARDSTSATPSSSSIYYDILRSIKRSLWYLDVLTLRISRGEEEDSRKGNEPVRLRECYFDFEHNYIPNKIEWTGIGLFCTNCAFWYNKTIPFVFVEAE